MRHYIGELEPLAFRFEGGRRLGTDVRLTPLSRRLGEDLNRCGTDCLASHRSPVDATLDLDMSAEILRDPPVLHLPPSLM